MTTFDQWWEQNEAKYSADACHMSEYHMASTVWAAAVAAEREPRTSESGMPAVLTAAHDHAAACHLAGRDGEGMPRQGSYAIQHAAESAMNASYLQGVAAGKKQAAKEYWDIGTLSGLADLMLALQKDAAFIRKGEAP